MTSWKKSAAVLGLAFMTAAGAAMPVTAHQTITTMPDGAYDLVVNPGFKSSIVMPNKSSLQNCLNTALVHSRGWDRDYACYSKEKPGVAVYFSCDSDGTYEETGGPCKIDEIIKIKPFDVEKGLGLHSVPAQPGGADLLPIIPKK